MKFSNYKIITIKEIQKQVGWLSWINQIQKHGKWHVVS